MNLADLVRLHGEVMRGTARLPRCIRVTEHAIPGSAVDVPVYGGGRELRIHPDDWEALRGQIPVVGPGDGSNARMIGLRVIEADPDPEIPPL